MLEHTWLKRRLLAQLRTERSFWLRRADGTPLPNVLAGIPARVEETRLLHARLIEGYSPAQLIEQSPLAALPTKVKKTIQSAVHQAYVDSGIIQPLAAQLDEALNDFELVASEVCRVWMEQG